MQEANYLSSVFRPYSLCFYSRPSGVEFLLLYSTSKKKPLCLYWLRWLYMFASIFCLWTRNSFSHDDMFGRKVEAIHYWPSDDI